MYSSSIILFTFILASSNLAQANSSCGNWTAFKDEKCYKLFKNVASYSDALNYCHQNDIDSSLILIKNKDEQDAIVKLIQASDLADNIWIGITKTDGIFKNSDQTDLEFENWAESRTFINKTGLDCVEISTDEGNYGKWLNEKCQKQNAIVCEKIQSWSTSRLQTILIDLKRDHIMKIMDINEELGLYKNRVVKLEQNPVPIGFIYVQILGQNDPKTLWQHTEWENISRKLAGLFFRVEGGQAAQFGQIQEQQTQSIVVMQRMDWGNYIEQDHPITIGLNYQSIFSGRDAGVGEYRNFHNFKHNMEEIRPINSAVRVWRRIK